MKNTDQLELKGNWAWGSAYSYHTLSSTPYTKPDGSVGFENEYTQMGELVNRLKYRKDKTTINPIVNLICKGYVNLEYLNYIIPVPPSDSGRRFQPVL